MRRARSASIAAISMIVAFVGIVPTAQPDRVAAASNDIVAIVLDGTGNGHGRGLSQWGAYGWAVDQNRSSQWILDHYYGGTVSGTVAGSERSIRVRLTAADGMGTVGVTSHGDGVMWNGVRRASMYATEVQAGRWQVFGSTSVACPSPTNITVPSGVPPIARNSGDAAGVRQIQRFLQAFYSPSVTVDGQFGPVTEMMLRAWQADRKVLVDGIWNAADAAAAQVQIEAAAGNVAWVSLGTVDGPVRFSTAGGDNPATAAGNALGLCAADATVVHHRGVLEVSSQSVGNRVVVELATEAYLRGVVPKEISAGWADDGNGRGAQAVRAQAVAARSYGLQQRRYTYADTCDTQSCQVYGGAATRATAAGLVRSVEHPATDAAILATAGVVRRWAPGHPEAGKIVATEFSASNGPRTAGGAFPAVDDEAGDRTAANPNHRWTRVLDADVLETRYGLGQLTAAVMEDAASSQYKGFDGIWFNDLVLRGTAGTTRLQAWDLKRQLDLPSPGFTVRIVRENTANRGVGVVGDSVTASIAASSGGELPRLLDGTFPTLIIDGEVSRCTVRPECRGASGLEAARALPAGLDLVVVELGYNDSSAGFAEAIDAMMAALRARNVGSVVWVNMADIATTSGRSRYGSMNAALAAAAATSSDLTVLDWNAASSGFEARARWFSDDVHLTATGRAQYSLWLRSHLVTALPSHRLVPPRRLELPVVGATVTGVDGRPVVVPPTATAVALNIASIDPADAGYVTAWPCAVVRPRTSNLNYLAREIVANNVLAPIDANGSVCLYSRVSTDLIVDVAGWIDGGAGDAGYTAATPVRAVDTRSAIGWPGRLRPGSPIVIDLRNLTVARPDGSRTAIPADVSAVNINLTATEGVAPGHLTVWPCDRDKPVASSVNYGAGQTVANGVTASVDGSGRLCIDAKSSTHVVVDVLGWFGGGDLLASTTPTRVVDTRVGNGGRTGPVQPGSPLVVPIRGRQFETAGGVRAVPATATAVVVDIAAVDPDRAGYLTVWPCQLQRPVASNVNYAGGRTVANGVVAPISADGTICLYAKSPTDVIVDVRGWFDQAGSGSVGFRPALPSRLVDTRIGVGPMPVS